MTFCPGCGALMFAGTCRKCNEVSDVRPVLSYQQQKVARNVEKLLRARNPSTDGFEREREDPTNLVYRRERMVKEVVRVLEDLGEHPSIVQQSSRHYHIKLTEAEVCLRPGSRSSRTIPRTAVGTKFSEAGFAIWDETIALEGASHLVMGVIDNDLDVTSDYYIFGAAEAMRLAEDGHGFIENPPESARNAWAQLLSKKEQERCK